MKKGQLISIAPRAASSHLDLDAICAALTEAFADPINGFSSIQRQAAFIGQLCVESDSFTAVVENLNYSAVGLLKWFPKYFDANIATTYAHVPAKIASRVYANRMGNGDEESMDGWNYRGRGLIQLTGKANYIACGNVLNVDLITNPNYLSTPNGAVESAIWYYTIAHNLNHYADIEDIVSITKAINGGTNGLQERINYYNKAKLILAINE